jgi:hypothetical protein
VRAGNGAGDDLRELARVVVGVAALDGHEHVHAVGAARLRERLEPERVERLLHDQRHLDGLGEARAGSGIEVEQHEVRPIGPVDARVPRVHVDAAHVDHPEERVLLVDDRRLDPPALPRRRACRDLDPEARDPVGHVRRRVLLEERLAERPVGIAAHREGPVAQMRHEHGRDGAVVLDQVALRDPLVGPEDLVEVRELHAAVIGLDGDLAVHVARRLVVAQTLEGRRAQMPVMRPFRELDLADELRLDPDDVALADLRHLRDDDER